MTREVYRRREMKRAVALGDTKMDSASLSAFRTTDPAGRRLAALSLSPGCRDMHLGASTAPGSYCASLLRRGAAEQAASPRRRYRPWLARGGRPDPSIASGAIVLRLGVTRLRDSAAPLRRCLSRPGCCGPLSMLGWFGERLRGVGSDSGLGCSCKAYSAWTG